MPDPFFTNEQRRSNCLTTCFPIFYILDFWLWLEEPGSGGPWNPRGGGQFLRGSHAENDPAQATRCIIKKEQPPLSLKAFIISENVWGTLHTSNVAILHLIPHTRYLKQLLHQSPSFQKLYKEVITKSMGWTGSIIIHLAKSSSSTWRWEQLSPQLPTLFL